LKKKKLFILSPFNYNYFTNNVNAVWLNNNLFKNGDLYFYFLSYNTFKIEFERNMFHDTVYEDNIKFTIDSVKTNSSLDFIKNNINEFEFYFFYPLNVFSYKVQMTSFISYFDIGEYYFRNNTDLNFLDQESFNILHYLKKTTDFNILKKTFQRKIYLSILSDKIFTYFYSKTTTSQNIDLLFLLIDQIIKKQMNKVSENILLFEKDNSVDTYSVLYKNTGNNLNFLYMYINFEDNDFNINNKDSYQKLENKFEIDGNIYLSDDDYNEKYHNLFHSNFQFKEVILYLKDWFSIEEIYYKMLHIYEYINVNSKNEIISYYSPINISIDIETICDDINNDLEKNDTYNLVYNLNNMKKVLEKSFIEEAIPIRDCPYCVDGKIYNGKNKFFCNHCNFFILKNYIKEKFNFDMTKRYLNILLNNKYITINYMGENRILYLRNSNGGFYLTLLKKR